MLTKLLLPLLSVGSYLEASVMFWFCHIPNKTRKQQRLRDRQYKYFQVWLEW